MWPAAATAGGHGGAASGEAALRIVGLSESYAVGEALSIRVEVTGGHGAAAAAPTTTTSCGDLYITIYDDGGESLVQEAFFGECAGAEGLELPAGKSFEAAAGPAGSYSVVAEMHIGADVTSAAGEFIVG